MILTPNPHNRNPTCTDSRIISGAAVLVLLLALAVSPCSAVYAFDGFPLKTVSQGQVDGQVFQYTIMGLQNSPRTLEFDLPADAEIQWARTYAGVWGGTPRYTGWVDVSVNGQDFGKTTLYGQDDKTPNVYCTGYGVYWTSWDSTSKVKNGKNTVVVTTSQGLPESKLDGRIYGVTTVVVAKTPGGADTRYWILEGNVNLHGEGWTAGANPTVNDATSATISLPDLSGAPHANLSIIELTSTRGLPDYVELNGKDLGSPATDPSMNYAPGAYDIADEMSYDNGYPNPNGPPATIMSRYWDSEIFDVTNLVKQGDNEVKFLRGKDLNGDGVINSNTQPYEGEDYLHPVFALLTLERPRASTGGSSASGTDLAIGKIEVANAYNGETATITATLQNLGARPSSPVPVSVSVDGKVLETHQVAVDASGVQQVTFSWPAVAGTHAITAEVKAAGDTVASDDAATKSITVGSLPDIGVSVGAPKTPGGTSQQKSPLPPALAVMAAVLAIGAGTLFRHRDADARLRAVSGLLAVLVLTACLSALVPAAAAATTRLYLVPVTVKNTGGSDAPAFSITIYLDGEKIATKPFDDGLAAGQTLSADIPVNTAPGSHTLKVVADEASKVRDSNRANNVAESAYVFP